MIQRMMKNKDKLPLKIKKPWPTKAVMQQIYDQKLWGGCDVDFYSGAGSHHPEIVTPYIETLTLFLKSFAKPLVVCDLGCGDFNVGKNLVKFTQKYVAVDIVPSLIARNNKKFKDENLEFQTLDIAKDDLPKGDCALLRQVLQHLSNQEVLSVVNQLKNYSYVIVTEHLPTGSFIPNKDIISGQGIRLKKQSGINLLDPPFHLKVAQEKELVSFPLQDGKSRIVTTLYKVL